LKDEFSANITSFRYNLKAKLRIYTYFDGVQYTVHFKYKHGVVLLRFTSVMQLYIARQVKMFRLTT